MNNYTCDLCSYIDTCAWGHGLCESFKLNYQKYEEKVKKEAYEQGRADAKKEFENEMQMLCKNYIEGAREQGKVDERERIVKLLKDKAWIEEDNAYLKFDTVLVPLQRLLDEIVRGGENE